MLIGVAVIRKAITTYAKDAGLVADPNKPLINLPKTNAGNKKVIFRIFFSALGWDTHFGAKSLIRKKDIINFKTGVGTIFDIDTKGKEILDEPEHSNTP